MFLKVNTKISTILDNYSSVANHAIAVYKESCKNLGVIPASYFLRNIEKEETVLDMKHHGLGRNGVKPIAVALVVSMSRRAKLSKIQGEGVAEG